MHIYIYIYVYITLYPYLYILYIFRLVYGPVIKDHGPPTQWYGPPRPFNPAHRASILHYTLHHTIPCCSVLYYAIFFRAGWVCAQNPCL